MAASPPGLIAPVKLGPLRVAVASRSRGGRCPSVGDYVAVTGHSVRATVRQQEGRQAPRTGAYIFPIHIFPIHPCLTTAPASRESRGYLLPGQDAGAGRGHRAAAGHAPRKCAAHPGRFGHARGHRDQRDPHRLHPLARIAVINPAPTAAAAPAPVIPSVASGPRPRWWTRTSLAVLARPRGPRASNVATSCAPR
jgi:hypothetical protein